MSKLKCPKCGSYMRFDGLMIQHKGKNLYPHSCLKCGYKEFKEKVYGGGEGCNSTEETRQSAYH